MSKATEVKFDIKVVINKEKTKVLFAEAGSDFTDVLLSILLLPLGTIMNVLKKHYGDEAPVIGSLNTLHKAWSLTPSSSDYGSIWGKLDFNYTVPTRSNSGKKYDGVFTNFGDKFIISDDLRIMPAVSIINTLSNLSIDITDMDGAETRKVTFGFDELMALLKEALISRNPLSAIILRGSQMNLATVLKYEHRNTLLPHIDEKAISMNSKKMVLKVMIQKSTFKLLFAQIGFDFLHFLSALLSLPLGRVEWYYGSNTGLKNIDNLHRSIVEGNFERYPSGAFENRILINPTVSNIDSSLNEFCPLNFDPNRHVIGSSMYMLSDDLTVKLMDITSGISLINELNISFSDVAELELQVGLEEGLSILKAALTSTTALTDSLIKTMLKKPKLES